MALVFGERRNMTTENLTLASRMKGRKFQSQILVVTVSTTIHPMELHN
jgi:hypothetical protein